ncbi:ABC transporter substrate-binding protein [Paenibacillus daejeonensis]|uniref:ABC transporter substrate-binding protein n=1 Tax=Paenibacillus daejeonensis TaxID=135193 RepID=UPI00035EECF8|nr:ABC transporter substrate-binding protein [Paenibacillus daejeonensis]
MKLILHRGFLLSLTLSLLLVLLAACGGTNETTDTNSGTIEAPPASESPDVPANETETEDIPETAGTRTVTTAAGEIDIPVQPERIVLTYHDDIDHFMALGLRPIGVPTYERAGNIDGYLPYLADQMEGIEKLGNAPMPEHILGANPDLIVAGYHHMPYVDELNKIAPTVGYDWVVDWRKTHLDMGRTFGLEEKAQANIDAFNAEVEQTKAYLQPIIGDEPTAFIRVRQKQLELYGAANTGSSASFILYDLLELTPVEEAPTEEPVSVFALESFVDLKAEHIFLYVTDGDENQQLAEDLLTNALYANVPAVQKGQVYLVESFPWDRGGPIAFTLGMQDIRDLVKP